MGYYIALKREETVLHVKTKMALKTRPMSESPQPWKGTISHTRPLRRIRPWRQRADWLLTGQSFSSERHKCIETKLVDVTTEGQWNGLAGKGTCHHA